MLSQAMKAWRVVLTRMKVGERWKVYVPPSMEFGDKRMSKTLGPHSVIVWEIDLLGVEGSTVIAYPEVNPPPEIL